MLSITIPSPVRKVADRFKSTVEVPYGALCVLFALHLFGCTSLCEAARRLAWSTSVSSLSRALSVFSSSRFMRRLRASTLRKIHADVENDPERFCYAVDDVPVERFGKRVFRIGSFKYHGGGLMRGQRILVLSVVDRKRGVALPLAFEVLTQRKDPEHRKAHEIALDLVDEVMNAGFPKLPFVFDSWFDVVELMRKFDERNLIFVVEMRANRCVKRCAAPGAKWRNWHEVLGDRIRRGVKLRGTERRNEMRPTRYIAEGRVFIRGHARMLKACAVYNKPSDRNSFAVYGTNDIDLSGAELWSLSRARWHIEELFRSLKQDFAFGKLPAGGQAATEASICFPFALYTSFVLDREIWSDRKHATVGSLVKEVRERALSEVLAECHRGSRRPALLILKSRRTHVRNNSKPVNPTADEICEWMDQTG